MHALIQEKKGRGSEKWKFTVIKGNHNHSLITEPGSHAAIRNIYKNNKFKAKIAAY
jgi:hypothetical protein